MIRRSTWIALGVFAVLLALAVWWSRQDSADPVELVGGTPAPAPLWEFTSDQIVTLRVESSGDDKVLEVTRDPDTGWRMTSPVAEPADAARVESVVTWLASPQVRGELPDADDLAPFGLETPAYRFRIQTRDDAEYSLEVGRSAPTGGWVYVRVPSRAGILLISEYGVQDVIDLYDSLPFASTPTPTLGAAPSATAAVEAPATILPEAALTPTP
jgi:hypothetical protein